MVSAQERNMLSYLTAEEKGGIDNALKNEIRPGIDALIAHSQEIRQAVTEVVTSNPTPRQFYLELTERWDRHNQFARVIDGALRYFWLKRDSFSPPVEDLEILGSLYRIAYRIDFEKSTYSAAIKPALVKFSEQITRRYNLNTQEQTTLWTLQREPLWVAFLADHLKYLVNAKSGEVIYPEATETALIRKYHLDDRDIFQQRLKENFGRYQDDSVEEMEEKLRTLLSRKKGNFVRKIYLGLERKDIQYFEKILQYDHLDEMVFAIQLRGIPDYLLRKFIIRLLIKRGLLDRSDNVFEYSHQEIINGIQSVREKAKRGYKLPLEPYYQTTPYTCGASCLAIVLNHFRGTTLSLQQEMALWEKIVTPGYKNNLLSGSAIQALEHDLSAVLYHSEAELFKYHPSLNKDDYENLVRGYKTFVNRGLEKGLVLRISKLDSEVIRKELEKGSLIILITTLAGVLHAVIVRGYKNNSFYLFDPISGFRKEHFTETERKLETPFGSWMLAINDRPVNFHNQLRDEARRFQ